MNPLAWSIGASVHSAWVEDVVPSTYRAVRVHSMPFPITCAAWLPGQSGDRSWGPVEEAVGDLAFSAGFTPPFPNPIAVTGTTTVTMPRPTAATVELPTEPMMPTPGLVSGDVARTSCPANELRAFEWGANKTLFVGSYRQSRPKAPPFYHPFKRWSDVGVLCDAEEADSTKDEVSEAEGDGDSQQGGGRRGASDRYGPKPRFSQPKLRRRLLDAVCVDWDGAEDSALWVSVGGDGVTERVAAVEASSVLDAQPFNNNQPDSSSYDDVSVRMPTSVSASGDESSGPRCLQVFPTEGVARKLLRPPSAISHQACCAISIESNSVAIYDTRRAGTAERVQFSDLSVTDVVDGATWSRFSGSGGGGGIPGFVVALAPRQDAIQLVDLRTMRCIEEEGEQQEDAAVGNQDESSAVVAKASRNTAIGPPLRSITAWSCPSVPTCLLAASGPQVAMFDATASLTEPAFVHTGHRGDVLHVAPHPSRPLVVSTATDSSLHVWSPDLRSGETALQSS